LGQKGCSINDERERRLKFVECLFRNLRNRKKGGNAFSKRNKRKILGKGRRLPRELDDEQAASTEGEEKLARGGGGGGGGGG